MPEFSYMGFHFYAEEQQLCLGNHSYHINAGKSFPFNITYI